MKKTNKKKLRVAWRRIKIGLFGLIFGVYFCSSVGLYNSMDAPQFFTTEAILEYRSLDLNPFSADPHFFVFPDIYYHEGQVLGVRGYLLSFFTTPLHLISKGIKGFYQTDDFPIEARLSANFTYELTVTSLFVLFTVVGLYFLYQGIFLVTKNNWIASVVIFLTAFGSYLWKYSSAYTRQGFLVFLIGISLYSALKLSKRNWLLVFLLCWAVAFGIDLIYFLAMSCWMGLVFFNHLWQSRLSLAKITIGLRKKGLIILPALGFIFLNIILNYYFYGTFYFSQTVRQPTIQVALGSKAIRAWLSTPLFPTLGVVLFNFGKIPVAAFRNYDYLPREVQIFSSLDFAKRYNFYGLCAISPFLFYCLFILLNKGRIQKNRQILSFCFTIFWLGIIGNAKVLTFWGGNQYDVRYFYPYILPLVLICGMGIKNIAEIKKRTWRFLHLVLFSFLGGFSLFMGWLGQIAMFKPSLTGERKIWIDFHSAKKVLAGHSVADLFLNTFMNKRNLNISLALILFILVFSGLISKIWLYWSKHRCKLFRIQPKFFLKKNI